MFCEYCGNKNDESHRFCTKCGRPTFTSNLTLGDKKNLALDEKWWHRLLKVIYLLSYVPLLIILPFVWSENSSRYVGYSFGRYQYEDTYSEAFWYSLLALAIYLVIIRLLKNIFQYIVWGQKPEWKKEFRKLY